MPKTLDCVLTDSGKDEYPGDGLRLTCHHTIKRAVESKVWREIDDEGGSDT